MIVKRHTPVAGGDVSKCSPKGGALGRVGQGGTVHAPGPPPGEGRGTPDNKRHDQGHKKVVLPVPSSVNDADPATGAGTPVVARGDVMDGGQCRVASDPPQAAGRGANGCEGRPPLMLSIC